MKAEVLFSAVLAAVVMTGSAKAQTQVNSDGGVRIGTAPGKVSSKATLHQNTPNPFSESTLIRYTLDKPADAALVVKDMKGRTVYRETLKKSELTGQVEIPTGRLAPGLYTYSLVSGTRILDTRKMTVTE